MDPSDLVDFMFECLLFCIVLANIDVSTTFFFSTMRECPPCLKHTQFSISLAHCFALLVSVLAAYTQYFICEPIEGVSYQ